MISHPHARQVKINQSGVCFSCEAAQDCAIQQYMAFFSRKMNRVHKILKEALSLFRSANDQKAIGIAANMLRNM
jgi:hypothetical protein